MNGASVSRHWLARYWNSSALKKPRSKLAAGDDIEIAPAARSRPARTAGIEQRIAGTEDVTMENRRRSCC